MQPRLSVVILTLNEEDNIAGCLSALAGQRCSEFEVIVIDADSQDRTAAMVADSIDGFPMPLHLEAVPYRIPIGAARNMGVQLARAPHVAFLSADAEPDPDWVDRSLSGLVDHAMVFGRQQHAPRRWTASAAARGLRYQFPDGHAENPLPFASNVASAYHKTVLEAFPFADEANAAEDLLLARRAAAAGNTAVYDPRMLVYHHDVTLPREEMRKNVREGFAWGAHRAELGGSPALLAWGAALAAGTVLTIIRPRLGFVIPALLWVPALRRAWRRRHAMSVPHIAAGVAVSPVYDVAFLSQYIRGLAHQPKQNTEATT